MRTLQIIIIFLFIQSANGQNNVAELKSFMDNIESTNSIKQKIKNKEFKNLEILDVYTELERKIDFGFKNHRILITPISGWWLKLNFISKDGLIKYGWVSEYDMSNKKHRNISLIQKSRTFLENYISKHNTYYGTNLNKSDFKKQIMAEYVVGFGCGFSGQQISKESHKTLKYSENKNVKKLNEFLTSFSPELQTLGTIGLLKINSINEQQKRIIEHLKKRNSEIFSCSGCVYGIGETYNERIKYYEEKASR